MTSLRTGHFYYERSGNVVQKKLPLINSAHGSETRNIINELIKLFNDMGYTYNEALQKAHDVLDEAQEVNDRNTNTNERLDNIIIESGTSDAEVVDARGEYTLLKNRLDSYNKRFNQADYVELLSKYNNFGNIKLHKINNYHTEIIVTNGKEHLTYFFQYNNDDYIVQSRIWAGEVTEGTVEVRSVNISDFNLTGTYVGPTESITAYTTNVGDTFEHSFTMEEDGAISLRLFKSGRGGMWKVSVDGKFVRNVSVAVEGSSTTEREFIANVDAGHHTIHGEFLGDDPKIPPSDGTARGWLLNMNSDILVIGRNSAVPEKDITITEPSNKEFAFNISPENGTYNQFVPFHGDPTAIEASPPVFKSGSEVIDMSSLGFGEMIDIDDFSLEQHVYGRHPESGETNLLEIWTTAKINKNTGMLSIDGNMRTLENVNFRNSYVIMGPTRGDQFDTVVSSYGNQYIADSSTYGSNIFLEEERDHATSYSFLSSENKELAFAFRFNNPKETLRQGEPSKDSNPEVMTYINNRNATVKKIYSRLYNNYDAMPGEVMRFSGDYLPVVGSNIFDLYSL